MGDQKGTKDIGVGHSFADLALEVASRARQRSINTARCLLASSNTALDAAIHVDQLQVAALVINTALNKVLRTRGGVVDCVIPAGARYSSGELSVETNGLGDETSTDGTRSRDCSSDCTLKIAGSSGELDIDTTSSTFANHDAVVQSVGAVDIDLGENATSVVNAALDLVGASS